MNFKYFLKATGTGLLKLVQYGCVCHVVTTYGVSFVTCEGRSMEPEIYHGDMYIVESVTVNLQKLKHGDIVGFKSMDKPNKLICKRIVGMEGDKIYNSLSQQREYVPKGHVWLEGDNKQMSFDSKDYGPVPYGLIFGRLIFKVLSGHNKSATNTVQTKTDS
ncbi:IMP1 inner mitochondrial membrane peptidase-like [Mactra antiquata]